MCTLLFFNLQLAFCSRTCWHCRVLQGNIFVYIRDRAGAVEAGGYWQQRATSERLTDEWLNTDSQHRDRPVSDLNTRLKGVCFPCSIVLLVGRVLTMGSGMLWFGSAHVLWDLPIRSDRLEEDLKAWMYSKCTEHDKNTERGTAVLRTKNVKFLIKVQKYISVQAVTHLISTNTSLILKWNYSDAGLS